ncbi:aldolase/citrate lyase family protein [Dankookia sp. P2]|uniref:aldolase/citrate lyase family protein n=1 Tax=Dankookia sp. P2 TaxID=3423955 RepID=UPI003D67096D
MQGKLMPIRINRAVELLQQDQAIYYAGHHTGHVLTHTQGMEDAQTWADYINIGMEHGAFDIAGLAEYMRGLVDGGPTRSGHRTPAVVVEAPVNGTDEANVRHNAWQFRQILGRGVHGVLLCQAETVDAARAFVEACRYPHHRAGVDPALPSALDRMRGAPTVRPDNGLLGVGTRGRGSERTAAPVWGIDEDAYFRRCEPWPLDPEGELLLGVKIESPEGVARCEEILAVPGIGFAEMGPGDLGLSLLGSTKLQLSPYPPQMQEARDRVFAACRANGIAFLESCTPDNVVARLDEGVRVIAGGREDTARVGRAHQLPHKTGMRYLPITGSSNYLPNRNSTWAAYLKMVSLALLWH